MNEISYEHLTSLFSYDKNTGLFKRLIDSGPRGREGDTLKSLDKNGYIRVGIDGRRFFAHRLAWFYVNKNWPNIIDHINGVTSDNRIENLRSVTNLQNTQNRHSYTSQYKGSYWAKNENKYVAQISWNKKLIRIGAYDDPKEAEKAFLEKKKERNEFFLNKLDEG